MPDVSGIELTQYAFILHPGLRAIFAPGSSIPNHDSSASRWATLHEPYTPDQLQHTLQSMTVRERVTANM